MLPLAVQELLPTPKARDYKSTEGRSSATRNDPDLSAVTVLLPTPAVNDMGEGKTVEAWDDWTAKMKAAHGNGNGHGPSLAIEAARLDGEAGTRLLPTPSVADATGGRRGRSGERSDELLLNGIAAQDRWGRYAVAICRWENATRPAPDPTEPSVKEGKVRLSARFVEWMMGLRSGHVTDVPNLSRNDQLKALGNGVVPQQAVAALRFLLTHP